MESKKPLKDGEELLRQALEECMEEDLSFVPPENEIARTHKFSVEFENSMEPLLQEKGKTKRKQLEKHEFVYGFHIKIAVILGLLLVGAIGIAGAELLPGKKAEDAQVQEGTEDASTDTEKEDEGAASEDSAPAEDSTSETVLFAGQSVEKAEEQILPEQTESVKTLVNCTVLPREVKEVSVTTGNLSEHAVTCDTEVVLEVRIDGVWYVVPKVRESQEQQAQNVDSSTQEETVLEPGMAVDLQIWLDAYDLDYDAEKYRLVTTVDGKHFSSEFSFEDPELEGRFFEPKEE